MKFIAIAAAVATLVALPQVGHAQSKATSKNTTTSGAIAGAEAVGAVFMPGAIGGGGAGAAAAASVGGFNQPQMIMNTGSAPSTGTFNDCGVAFSGGLWLLTFSYTGESKSCVAQRQAIFAAASLGRPDIAMERMCDDEDFRKANERTNGGQCAVSVEARRVAEEKANRNRPVSAVQPAPVPVQVALFQPQPGWTAAQCLTAAYSAGADTAACRGLS